MAGKQVYTVQHTALGANASSFAPAYAEGDDYIAPDVNEKNPDLDTQAKVDAHTQRLLDIGAIAPKTEKRVVTVPAASIIRTSGSDGASNALAREGVTHPNMGKKITAQPEVQTPNNAETKTESGNE